MGPFLKLGNGIVWHFYPVTSNSLFNFLIAVTTSISNIMSSVIPLHKSGASELGFNYGFKPKEQLLEQRLLKDWFSWWNVKGHVGTFSVIVKSSPTFVWSLRGQWPDPEDDDETVGGDSDEADGEVQQQHHTAHYARGRRVASPETGDNLGWHTSFR